MTRSVVPPNTRSKLASAPMGSDGGHAGAAVLERNTMLVYGSVYARSLSANR
jgi:hypothetical protein